MADIAFLLIIFFMVTTVYQVDKTEVDLPVTQIRMDVPSDAAFIVISDDGLVKFSDGKQSSELVGEISYLAGYVQSGYPALVAQGISVALITTAGGLIVAVFTLPFYNVFSTKISGYVQDMEISSNFLFETFEELSGNKS